MKVNMRLFVAALSAIFIIGVLAGCEQKTMVSPDQAIVMQNCEELFNRIKVKDYEVIYENEFPYLHEKMDLEEFLNNQYIKWYNPDTLVAIQIDSAAVWKEGDSAYVFMELEWVLADSSLSVQSIRLPFHYVDDKWIKPTMSRLAQQKLYEEELKVYWDAVKAMQERENKKNGDSL